MQKNAVNSWKIKVIEKNTIENLPVKNYSTPTVGISTSKTNNRTNSTEISTLSQSLQVEEGRMNVVVVTAAVVCPLAFIVLILFILKKTNKLNVLTLSVFKLFNRDRSTPEDEPMELITSS